MKVTYVGPSGSGETIEATGQHVGRGEAVEVDDEVAEALVRSASWVEHTTTADRQTIEEILADVGDDSDAAAAAIAAEEAAPRPRTRLLDKLREIAASGGEG